MRAIGVLLLVLLGACASASAFYSDAGPVINLMPSTLKTELAKHGGFALVEVPIAAACRCRLPARPPLPPWPDPYPPPAAVPCLSSTTLLPCSSTLRGAATAKT